MYYDRDLVWDAISSEEICKRLGLPIKKVGKHLTIPCPCPAHNDKKRGNCIINENGIYDFAGCGTINKFQIIVDVLHVSFNEALALCAKWIGIEGEKADFKKITSEEYKILGLKRSVFASCPRLTEAPNRYPEKFHLKEMDYIDEKESWGCVYGTTESYSMDELKEDNEALWNEIVKDKVIEKFRALTKTLSVYNNEEGKQFLEENGTSYEELEETINKEFYVLENIIKKIA